MPRAYIKTCLGNGKKEQRVDMSRFKGKVGQTFHLIGCPSGEKWGHLKKKRKSFQLRSIDKDLIETIKKMINLGQR